MLTRKSRKPERIYDMVRKTLDLKTDPATDEACRFLESRGWRFCIDFGTDNAVRHGIDVMEAELEMEGVRELERLIGWSDRDCFGV